MSSGVEDADCVAAVGTEDTTSVGTESLTAVISGNMKAVALTLFIGSEYTTVAPSGVTAPDCELRAVVLKIESVVDDICVTEDPEAVKVLFAISPFWTDEKTAGVVAPSL